VSLRKERSSVPRPELHRAFQTPEGPRPPGAARSRQLLATRAQLPHPCQSGERVSRAPAHPDEHLRASLALTRQGMRAAGRDQAAATEHQHPVAQHEGLGEDVGGEQNGLLRPPPPDERAQVGDLVGIETGGGLIQDEQLRIGDEALAQPDALAKSAGEVRRLALPDTLQAQHPARPLERARERRAPEALQAAGQGEILPHAHLAVERGILRQVTEAPLRLRALAEDVFPSEEHLSPRRHLIADQHPHGGRLARAVGTEQTDDLSNADLEAQIIDGAHRAVVLRQRRDLEQRQLGGAHRGASCLHHSVPSMKTTDAWRRITWEGVRAESLGNPSPAGKLQPGQRGRGPAQSAP
jgi:hypothetical protein